MSKAGGSDDELDLIDYTEEEEATTQATTATTGPGGSYSSSSFKDFLLKEEIMRAIGDCGFEHPSEVQHNAIPAAMLGTDLICQAKSGLGKTACFVIPVLQQIDPKPGQVDTLVLAHTKELAYQICAEFDRLGKYCTTVKPLVIFGGVPVTYHQNKLREMQPNVIIGTPGRVMDLILRGDLKVDKLQRLVLDECDHLIDEIGMRKQVQEIFKKTPRQKQVMVLSATMSKNTKEIARKICKDPQEIYIDDMNMLKLDGLSMYYVKLTEREKLKKLESLLDALDFNQVIIFCKTIARAEQLNQVLKKLAFPSMVAHGRRKTQDRLTAYKDFKDFKCRILVSSQLLGRGVDFEKVNVVINFDMPKNDLEYLHKAGRAGRFGTKGLAISFVCDAEDEEIMAAVRKRYACEITNLPESVDKDVYKNK